MSDSRQYLQPLLREAVRRLEAPSPEDADWLEGLTALFERIDALRLNDVPRVTWQGESWLAAVPDPWTLKTYRLEIGRVGLTQWQARGGKVKPKGIPLGGQSDIRPAALEQGSAAAYAAISRAERREREAEEAARTREESAPIEDLLRHLRRWLTYLAELPDVSAPPKKKRGPKPNIERDRSIGEYADLYGRDKAAEHYGLTVSAVGKAIGRVKNADSGNR